MKKILVLTDFSENANHAAQTAVMFSEKLKANLLLLHNMASIPVTPYYIGGGFVAEEAGGLADAGKKNFDRLIKILQPIIALIDPLLHKPSVHTQLVEGNIAENLAEIIRQKDIELIVMGAKTGTTIDHILTGSETRAVIDHASKPVLIVPQIAEMKKLKKVVFATDFNEADTEAVKYLVKLGKLFDFKLEIVHINLMGKDEKPKDEQEMAFVAQIVQLDYPKIIYKEVRGKDVIGRLNSLCEETGADMLALVHYPHSFFSRITHDSHTNKALAHQTIPLLVFSSKMKEKV